MVVFALVGPADYHHAKLAFVVHHFIADRRQEMLRVLLDELIQVDNDHFLFFLFPLVLPHFREFLSLTF